MGLPRAAVHLLLTEACARPFGGRIATLGRQHVYLSADELLTMASRAGTGLRRVTPQLHQDAGLRKKGFLSDESLYEMLGFESSVRIDQSSYEGAEEKLDLNDQATPDHLCGAFDVVLDSGTVEHIFDIAQAVRHCLRMTRPGGRIVHLTPSSNSVNHGLYSVSPSLYADFYSASGCSVDKLWLCRMPKDFERGPWKVYDCLQTDRNWLPLGRLDGSIWFTFAVITKGLNAEPVTPQQAFYVSTWNHQSTLADDRLSENSRTVSSGSLDNEPATSRAGRLLKATEAWPLLNSGAAALVTRWRDLVNWNRERRRGRVPFPFVGEF